ncbi:bifunctional 2-polyprenyl-6-hydroxyphenol methylase/3-demethylubiquinol 3-O-methyltransferase UbiG [Paenibacillus sp. DCT19]|uniref:class I SAM-dependent methyltransferase n=1 Tax=Paenibacillus sp. DCT19 TaxID=2211212 RepID=UPI0020C202BA|nr:class I SAM-dependent methyltransferase [Paenibacillus sp. DCT19]
MGEEPSRTVNHAMDVFASYNVQTVLVPGSGYGRNTRHLSCHFSVVGLEFSKSAIEMSKGWDEKTRVIECSILEPFNLENKWDAIYCYNVLHLFLMEDRMKLIHNSMKQLRDQGIMYFTCFSDQDQRNGRGSVLEDNTYEYKEGKAAHFFTEQDLIQHFAGMRVIETGLLDEEIPSSETETEKYNLRYIIVQMV